MSNRDKGSRLDKFEKRRKNTKLMTLMMIAAGALAVLLIGVFIFSDSSAEKQREQAAKTGVVKEPAKTKKEQPAKEENEGDSLKIQEDEAKAEEKQDEEKQDKDKEKDENELKTEQVKPSDDNVAEAFTANWEPVGTSQKGAHTTNYNEGSKDRKEMEKAIKLATGLKSMTTWWLGRSGEQGVEATVSNKEDDSEVYRVKLKWVDGKGWKPDRVELLKKNDQAYRYR